MGCESSKEREARQKQEQDAWQKQVDIAHKRMLEDREREINYWKSTRRSGNYQVISSHSKYEVIDQVQLAVQCGWQVHGSISCWSAVEQVWGNGQRIVYYYAQAIGRPLASNK